VHRQSRSVPLLSMIVAAIGRRLWTVPIVWALGLMLAAAVVTGANAQVLVVLSEDWPGMREVAAELREQLGGLRDGRLTIDVVTAKRIKLDDLDIIRRSELIIAVGVEAARAVIDREKDLSRPPPTLCLLIPKLRFDAFVGTIPAGSERRVSAVFIDQPVARQFNLLRLAAPTKSRIGIVLGPSSSRLQDELRDNARERAMTLNIVIVDQPSGMFAAMQKTLSESDLFLALPDPVTINESTAYAVLRTSYQEQIPVAGFSESMVRAGALFGLYSTLRQQARQGAEIASRLLAGEAGLPPPQYPRYFTVGVNTSVARSLGVQLDAGAIEAALAARERGSNPRETRTGTEAAAPRRTP